jgi:NAD(P)-dependent dehydrogenase (short-subunit alcohol dehydrogenase family)
MTASTSVRKVHVVGGGELTPLVELAVPVVDAAAHAACIVAPVPARAPLAELSDARLAEEVGGVLERVLGAVQGELAHLQPGGRLVFVLPAAPLMAVSGGAAASAVTNGVLSMARTLSIELARDAVTVNVLAIETEGVSGAAGRAAPAALSAQLAALLGPGGEQITGQEIYLTAGSDLGRLRP